MDLNEVEFKPLEDLLICYQEAEAWLAMSARECQKTRNVDLEVMIGGCHNTRDIIRKLRNQDLCPLRQAALEQLDITLVHHLEVLQRKKTQLSSGVPLRQRHAGHKDSDEGTTSMNISRQLSIEDTIITPGKISFDDVAGLTEAKQLLREAIIMPMQYPHLFKESRKPWKRILLYGPPGTGKSRLAQALSSQINCTFYCVSSSDLMSSWVGESEKLIKELFQHAMSRDNRSVIFIDEIDSVCRSRSSREEEYTRRVKTELLKQMEGADYSQDIEKIFLLCATNRPWELDSAFLRRFQKRIYIPLPDKLARISLLKIHTKKSEVEVCEEELRSFAEKTNGYSGSDLSNLILSALFEPIRDMQKATSWCKNQDDKYTPCESSKTFAISGKLSDFPPCQVQPRAVTYDDLLKSLECCQKTVSQDELLQFDEFTKQLGHNVY